MEDHPVFPQSTAPDSLRAERNVHGRVILLHGLMAHPWMMRPLATRLQTAGYEVLNWGYPSLRQHLPELVEVVLRRYEDLVSRDGSSPHLSLVGHSMGAIISRALAARLQPEGLQRIVMISPPNGGSHVASYLAGRMRWVIPSLDYLADHPESFVNSLPQEFGVEVGVIAASQDLVVRESSTHLQGERDHIVVPGMHAGILFRRDVADQTAYFLENGRFQREDATVGSFAGVEVASPSTIEITT